MGRGVKRIDPDFDWFEKTKDEEGNSKTWFGYVLNSINCEACDSEGKNLKGKICPLCEGEMEVYPEINPPEGEGWQMWEETSEGSPISPVFKTAKQLAKWLEDNNASAMGSDTATKEEWLSTIKSKGVTSGVIIDGEMMSGVKALHKVTEKK